MYLIPTIGAERLAAQIGGHNGIETILPGKSKDGNRTFPDGEIYARIEGLQDPQTRVVILHAGQPDPNEGLVELEMILEILRHANVTSPEVFFTYFPYGMQDKVFRAGEMNVAEALLRKLFTYYGVTKVYAVDPHFQEDEWLATYRFASISAVPFLKAAALGDYPEMMFVTPDAGSQARTKHAGLAKTRADSFNVEFHHDEEFAASVRGKDVGVIDDLVETGGTLVRFREKCREYGARSVVALVTHGVLPSGIARLQAAYDRLYLADTIDRPEANVGTAELIAAVLSGNP